MIQILLFLFTLLRCLFNILLSFFCIYFLGGQFYYDFNPDFISLSTKLFYKGMKRIRLIEFVVLIALLVGVGYFVQDVCKDYLSQTTSIKQYTEIWEKLPAPTITICFNPGAKKSILDKYNLTLLQFSGSNLKMAFLWLKWQFKS